MRNYELGLSDEKVYGSLDMRQNINYSEIYPHTYTPGLLRPVKKKVKQKRTINPVTSLFVVLMLCFVSLCILPFSYKYFVQPLFVSPDEKPFRVDFEKLYAPTSSYLYNDRFLDSSSLIGAKTEKPVMTELPMTSSMPALESSLAALANEYPQIHPSVFVWDYESGKYASLNSDEAFPAASIIKIPVLLQLFRSMEAGQRSIDDKMTLTDYYRAEGSGDLQFQRTGNQYSLDSLARKMIEISDNSSTNMLMSSVGGMNDVNRAIKSWGLKKTQINNWLPDMGGTNVTTTEDLARMIYNIENENFLSRESKDRIFDYMGHVKNNRLIHAGLGSGAKIYHKTGDIGHMLGDAGLVITPDGHKYIVTIMLRRPYNHPAGKEFTVRASSLVYNHLANRNLN